MPWIEEAKNFGYILNRLLTWSKHMDKVKEKDFAAIKMLRALLVSQNVNLENKRLL